MISYGVKSNVDAVAKQFEKTMGSQVPFATSLAINNVAFIARTRLIYTMQHVFDNPTPWTLNSLIVKKATKQTLLAWVGHNTDVDKGSTPASKYLRPEIEGGIRYAQKKSEIAIAEKCGVPNGIWVPAKGIANSYGNVSGALVTKILSTIGALTESGFSGNQTARSKKKLGDKARSFFIMKAGNTRGLKPGVYEKIDDKIRPVLFVIPSGHYKKLYEFEKIVQDVIKDHMDLEFAKAMDYALATAKVKIPVR